MGIPFPESTGNPLQDRNNRSIWTELQRLSGLLLTGKTAAPTVSDDYTTGIAVGTVWVDEMNDNSYQCQDNTAGAAVWAQID